MEKGNTGTSSFNVTPVNDGTTEASTNTDKTETTSVYSTKLTTLMTTVDKKYMHGVGNSFGGGQFGGSQFGGGGLGGQHNKYSSFNRYPFNNYPFHNKHQTTTTTFTERRTTTTTKKTTKRTTSRTTKVKKNS